MDSGEEVCTYLNVYGCSKHLMGLLSEERVAREIAGHAFSLHVVTNAGQEQCFLQLRKRELQ